MLRRKKLPEGLLVGKFDHPVSHVPMSDKVVYVHQASVILSASRSCLLSITSLNNDAECNPSNISAFKLAQTVVEDTLKGAVPVAMLEVNLVAVNAPVIVSPLFFTYTASSVVA